MSCEVTSYVALVLAILGTAFSHVLLRLGSRAAGKDRLRSLFFSAAGYGLFLFVTVLIVIALMEIPLRLVAAWNTLSFVLTMVAARLFLREPLPRRRVLGSFLILLGALTLTVF